MNKNLIIYLLFFIPLATAQVLHPSTSGYFGNTSISTTSSVFSDVVSFNFTNLIATPVTCFDITTILSQASGGSGMTSEYQLLANGVVVGSTSRTLANGEIAVPFLETNHFIVSGLGSELIQLQHRRASGTGTLTTTRTSNTVFCLTDMETGIDLPFGNQTVSTSFSSLSAVKQYSFNLTLDEARRVVVLGSEKFVKTTTGTVYYYANITYSNGTTYVCPTISRYIANAGVASTGYACITPDNAPTGSTEVAIYAWNTVGSTTETGELNAFGYSGETQLDDGKMVRLNGLNVTSTSSIAIANTTIDVETNQTNVYALAIFSGNASTNGLSYTGVLSIKNSSNMTPVMIDSNLYPSTFTIPTANQNRVTKQQRDFRNVSADNYTVYYNLSVSTGTLTLTDGALLALRTDRIPNTIQPLAPSFITPDNTTYSKNDSTLMLVEWTNAQATSGANISGYNLTTFYSNGTINAILNPATLLTSYIWNFSNTPTTQYYMQVIATDNLGNTATGTSEIFTITTTAPAPTPTPITLVTITNLEDINGISSGVFIFMNLVTLAAIGYLVYYIKRKV